MRKHLQNESQAINLSEKLYFSNWVPEKLGPTLLYGSMTFISMRRSSPATVTVLQCLASLRSSAAVSSGIASGVLSSASSRPNHKDIHVFFELKKKG